MVRTQRFAYAERSRGRPGLQPGSAFLIPAAAPAPRAGAAIPRKIFESIILRNGNGDEATIYQHLTKCHESCLFARDPRHCFPVITIPPRVRVREDIRQQTNPGGKVPDRDEYAFVQRSDNRVRGWLQEDWRLLCMTT